MSKYHKTLLFLNLRFANFYSPELIKNIPGNVRIVAIIDQQFKHNIPSHIASRLHQTYILPSNPKLGFLGEFEFSSLQFIVQEEMLLTDELRIICSDEFNLLNAGKLREIFNLAGHKEAELFPFRDKIQMKALLANKNIRVPKYKPLMAEDSFAALSTTIGLPFVIKPTDSCGSHGVNMISSAEDFITFKKTNPSLENFEVEEFIKGRLFHVDTYIKDHEIKFICANQYMHPNFEFTQGKPLGSFPLDDDDKLAKPLMQFATAALQALNANNLISHMELFVTPKNEIVFLEASARPPGALLNLTHQINFGMNLMDEDFMLQSGITIKFAKQKQKETEKVFFAFFPLRPGKIIKLNAPPVKSRYDITWHVKEGDVVAHEDCTNIVNKSAQAIFYNTNLLQLKADFELVKHHLALEVVHEI